MKTIRNIAIIISAIFIVIALPSCELEEYNPSGSTADAIWSTPEGYQTLVNACYYNLRNFYGKIDGPFMSEVGNDLWFNKQKDGYHRQTSKYDGFVPSMGNFNKSQWPSLYEGLNLCNAGVGRADEAGFPSEEAKNKKLGEVRFVRAFYLWHIVETWGGVYLPTTETTEPILYPQRSSIEDFYKVIIEDLEFAVEYLPLDHGDEYGRASKKSAMALLARIYLTCAYYDFEGNADEYFTKARDLANQVISDQKADGQGLWDDPRDLWDPNNNVQNKEALYIVSNASDFSLNYENGHKLHIWFITQYAGKPGLTTSLEYGNADERRLMPTLHLLDLFDESIDARYEASFREVYLANDTNSIPRYTPSDIQNGVDSSLLWKLKFHIGDTALIVTKKRMNVNNKLYIVIDRDSIYDPVTRTIRTGQDYPSLKKFDDPITRGEAGQKISTMDILVIRLAEMYLISAEASLKLGQQGDAYDKLLELANNRAYGNDGAALLAAYGIASASDVDMDFIIDERGRELCGEHFRWFDLKRMFCNRPGEWVAYIKETNPDITLVQEHHMVRPIHQIHLDPMLNSEEFGQTSGY